jgi:hypothetical protein
MPHVTIEGRNMSDFDMWADDPVLSPILRRMEASERRYEAALKRLQANEEHLNQHETVLARCA